MTFTFASWNVNSRRLTRSHVDLLDRAQCDVVALQETGAEFHSELATLPLFQWSVSSLALRPPGPGEGRARRFGCSLFGRFPFRLICSGVLGHLKFPERALISVVNSGDMPITFGSFHTPPGANWGEIKPQTLKAIATWLAEQNGRIVFGIDANTPKTDHPNIAENEWWWDDEPILLGASPSHRLRDAFRLFLDSRPDSMAKIRADSPQGPLAISHYRGRGQKRTACRYDFIYITPDFSVEHVEYRFDEPVKACSDHAIVIARLCLHGTAAQQTG